ncbi:MAG: helix-turn-helix domain-containing protein [Clostridiales Family XIII bacterium]|jgi:AraC-like DNA-binding protein|nr:helix-turn-helix domain-containing protein [Clostridiales Family XIII bacterium]
MIENHDIQYRYYEVSDESLILPVFNDCLLCLDDAETRKITGKPFHASQKCSAICPFDKNDDVLHFHNLFEVGYCISGSGHIEFEKDCIPFSADSITIIPPGCVHKTVRTEGTNATWEYFFVDNTRLLSEIYGEGSHMMKNILSLVHNKPRVISTGEMPLIRAFAIDILNLHRDKPEFYLESSKGLLLALLTGIASLVTPDERDENVRPESYSVIAESLKYVDENYDQKIQIRDMAQVCNLSETHFRRLFAKIMNMSPLEYVNIIRIDAACKRLSRAHENVQYIADSCGFFTIASFNRNFKSLIGCSPLQWKADSTLHDPHWLRNKLAEYQK